MKVLSLFDGISVAQQALKSLGIDCEYYASEIDRYAIQLTQKNFPNTIFLGDVKNVENIWIKFGMKPDIDLLIGGSPCQDLSIAKKNREGLSGSRSGLFYEYVRILKETQPKYFVLENVNSMPKEAKETITKELFGIEPVMINAALVSAQNRKRLFWVGKLVGDTYEKVDIELPHDREILLKDILENGVGDDKSYCIPATYYKENTKSLEKRKKTGLMIRIGQLNQGGQGERIYSTDGKSVNLSANGGGRGAKTGLYAIQKEQHGTALDYYNDTIIPNNKAKVLGTNPQCMTAVAGQVINDNSIIRKLTCIECERLQSLPDNYTSGVSNSQRYKALGNAFNCEVIKHILKALF